MDTVVTETTADVDAIAAHCTRLPNWRDLAPNPDALAARCSLVRMTDNAMVGAGLPRGSHALVMVEREFSSGDIVLAHTPNGESTIKWYVTQDHPPYVSLRPDPEGAVYATIACGPDTELLGRVIGVVRGATVHSIVNANR